MKPRLFAVALLSLSIGCTSANAQPTYKSLAPADYKVPAADLEKWATRLRRLCPAKDWTVAVENNDVLITRRERIQWSSQGSQAAPDYSPLPPGLPCAYQVRLRFSPRLTLDEFDELETVNLASSIEDSRLLMKYDLSKYSRQNWGFGLEPWGEGRKQYLEESKKLVFHQLPHFYCADYSFTVFKSPFISNLRRNNLPLVAESKHLEAALNGYFGRYRFTLASGLPYYVEDELTKQKTATYEPA